MLMFPHLTVKNINEKARNLRYSFHFQKALALPKLSKRAMHKAPRQCKYTFPPPSPADDHVATVTEKVHIKHLVRRSALLCV